MANRLAHENSPYLLQHAENPVDWYPWGEEALQRAQQEDKPIFLSIGYAACHWCHVMAHESFEDPETARIMNEHFINIKVDREERPDLDSIYMNAVVAMTGQGGWPMSLFLTPDGRPFFGGTYFPPTRRYGMPSFREVLLSVARTWQDDPQRLIESGAQIREHLQDGKLPQGEGEISAAKLEEAALRLAQSYDWQHGGWGQAPKFPQPMSVEFLLRRATRGDRLALDMALHCLDVMARGGMYDVVGGGFARYSTDNNWLVPHFEKMLYDNAQLAQVYLYAYLLTKQESYRRVCEETLGFMARELGDEDGGFYSSLDADSEGEEGKYYLWTPAEIRHALADPQDAEFFIAAYGVTEGGNFEGKTVLQRALSEAELSQRFNLPAEEVPPKLAALHTRLLEVRETRVRPGTDDKVLVFWNALALAAFAEAARYLQRPDYLHIARRNADFLLTELNPNDRLLRSWRKGKAQHPAYLEDYAALIIGLLALYQSDPDPYWYSSAVQLAEQMTTHFSDPEGGFFDTRDDQETLIYRPKEVQDNATPSGSALAAQALVELAAFSGRGDWRDTAEAMLRSILVVATQYPTAFGRWLCAGDLALGPLHEVALITPPTPSDQTAAPDASLQALLNALWQTYRPRLVLAQSAYPPPSHAPALLQDRPVQDEKPTAYVCLGFVCQMPVNTAQALEKQLE